MPRPSFCTKQFVHMLLEPVLGYTRVVFATKFLLVLLALGLVLGLVLLPLLSPVHNNFRISLSSIETGKTAENPKMVNPHFQGVDKDDQTYNVSADSAIKMPNNDMILDNINADINLKNGEVITLLAKSAAFNYEQNTLNLNDTVSIFTNDGYELYTQSLTVNAKESSAEGKDKIYGYGPIGSITADSFQVKDRGEYVRFSGNVKMTFFPNGVKKKK